MYLVSLNSRSNHMAASLRRVLIGLALAVFASGCAAGPPGRPGSELFNCLDHCYCADRMNCHSCVNQQCHRDCR
jgi:hypothetical protein